VNVGCIPKKLFHQVKGKLFLDNILNSCNIGVLLLDCNMKLYVISFRTEPYGVIFCTLHCPPHHTTFFLTFSLSFQPSSLSPHLLQAAILGDHAKDAKGYGWNNLDAGTHDWATLRSNVQDYIKGLNFSYRVQLREAGVTYLNKLGEICVLLLRVLY